MKSETGRSMVEMLGVLAIIGVLSIGGIAGYTLSMRKHRANQVADALNKYALIVYDSCQKALIQGDITEMASCQNLEPWPTYTETGLVSVSDLKKAEVQGVYEYVIVWPYFNDENMCNAVRSVTGWYSNHHCADDEPYYEVLFYFN